MNLCKPNTFLNWTNSSGPKGFGLGKFYCMYNGEIGHKYSAFNQLWFFNFQISTTKETFQDLSLPIPSKDHLYVLHSNAQGSPIKGGACGEAHQTWMTWILTWMKRLVIILLWIKILRVFKAMFNIVMPSKIPIKGMC